ncbi:5'-3' exonuclease [Amphibacillus marinus]|uniref:5'-3' exonuclease n=1 Tax=Amphibacillus marinus TaxID=872970 RepID=A0A1H8QHF6_9BACI|nr:5'-3' exonuclease [Amphibacillus marinus]SEO53347.1 5'-3' exonuclease [Amphibacillus marinus]
MSKERLLIIDGFNLLSRGYFATAYNKSEEQLSRNSSGLYTNALRVFFQKLFNLIEEHEITHLAIAWDVKREETARRQKYDFYKATRGELPFPLIQQYETLTQYLEKIGVYQLTLAPYEADDLIGTLARQWSSSEGRTCLIYSNDKDLLQLLGPRTSQIIAQKRTEITYTLQHFKDEYGIEPAQWIDVKALLGDASDNVPGVAGVGAKSALPLIQDYQTIEQLYERVDQLDPKYNRYQKKLIAGKESARISKELVTINCLIEHQTLFTDERMMLAFEKELVKQTLHQLEVKVRIS